MERNLNERLVMIADLEERGYSQELIEGIVDYCENPDQEGMRFSSMEEYWKWFNEEYNK